MTDVEVSMQEEVVIEPSTGSDNGKKMSSLSSHPPSILHQMFAEAIGTMFIVITGVAAVNAAVIANGAAGNLQVGLMFGLGITFGIYTAGPISGGHLNPAITAAFAVLRPRSLPFWKVPCYWFAQYFGAFVGASLVYAMWSPAIGRFEELHGITRGEEASDLTVAMFAGVFPFPAAAAEQAWLEAVSPALALFIEAFGAGVLCFVVFVVLDERNAALKGKDFAPVLIGLSIAVMIVALSPLTTGCFNPARDGGPRLLALLAGWRRRAFPGRRGGFWVYFVGPCLGAIIGGGLYDFGLGRAYSGKFL